MKEIWKDIKGYEGLYHISNLGRVKNANGLILSSANNGKGYCIVSLYRNGKQKTHRIHRLVAIAFIPNPNNLPEVNHKDEKKENNEVSNLEWCTHDYNCNYGTKNERQSRTTILNGSKKGVKHPMARKIICITTWDIYNYISQITKSYNIPQPEITQCCQGKRKSAGKHPETGEPLKWMYYDDFINPYWYINDDFTNPFWFEEEEIINTGLCSGYKDIFLHA